MFAPSQFRGGFGRGGGRGGSRGRGDWDQRGGRNFYDERDRYPPRSRSQESRWGREQEDRDRRDSRYPDSARDPRDDRDVRDRERETIRPKPDRVSHEPPSAKDVSPPPLAPSAPAFGSVPSRQPSSTDIQSLTGKPPPTGPRALAEDRPAPTGPGAGNERPPPTGPSKPALSSGSPSIPLGPRAQQKQQRSSKQWINPSIAVKKAQESPKGARSQSFVSQEARPFYRPESSHSEYHGDFEKRPRSPDAKSDSHATSADRYGGLHLTGPNDIAIKSERGSQSARTSVDRETRTAFDDGDVHMGGTESSDRAQQGQQPTSPAVPKTGESAIEATEKAEKPKEPAVMEKKHVVIAAPSSRVQLPDRDAATPAADVSYESDDDEDFDDYFEKEISRNEAELKKLEDAIDKVPVHIVRRYATVVHEAMLGVLKDSVNLVDLIGPIPQGFTFPRPRPGTEAPDKKMADPESQANEMPPATREPSAIPTVEGVDSSSVQPPEPQPKVEETDTEGSGLPPVPALEEIKPLNEDVDMHDASEHQAGMGPTQRLVSVNGMSADGEGPVFFPPPFDQPETGRSSPSPDDESEDRTEDDASIYGSVEVVREYSTTPPPEDLPVYNVKPWYHSRRVRGLGRKDSAFGDFLLGRIQDQAAAAEREQDELRREYEKNYEAYLRFTLSDDPAAVKSREYFTSSGVQSAVNSKSASSESKPEGGRRAAGRFSTELDLDYAIQQSIREHQEKKEREERAQKEKYRSDKEAAIPEMFWTEEEKEQASFYDTAGLLPLEKLVATWQVVPWHVNFTEEEAGKFEKSYLEFPKQWGKIARELPDRDFGTCIQYYYAKKRDLNLKEKLKKQPRRRKKGRGKQRSSALVSELGNTENETEDATQENGENGERRRPPRRAAAPTWGYEATPNADSDGAASTATPGRRRAGTAADAKNESGAEKPEAKKGGRRRQKADKEAKGPKPAQTPTTAPLAVPGKPGRSRANSRVQGQEWMSPQTPVDLAARAPVPFEAPPGGMQPPLAPVQQPPLASPERAAPPIASTISEVMAPPSLRPEPPPPPASVPTFEISQPPGSERIRTPQQASSYWSVSESTDFPGLLRSFGTDWASIANHMQTKTATMVKNYYVRQTKEGGKPEWEQVANDADAKRQRGEKRPPPPAPTQGPRNKRYDVPTSGPRPLAAAEPDEVTPTKVEPPVQSQPFTRFQVPIAQAAPVSHPLVQPAQAATTAPLASSTTPRQQPPPSGSAVTQAMSPHANPLRPPGPAFPYPEREAEPTPVQPPAQAQQPVRISQKPAPAASSIPPVSESVQRQPGWARDMDNQFSLLTQQKELRDARERQRLDLTHREPLRPVERAPLRMKQEPEQQPLHHPEAYPPFQAPQRAVASRIEPAPLARQPEPPRTASPAQQSYAPPVHAQTARSLLRDPVPMHQTPPPVVPASDRPPSGMQRPTPVSMQEQYGATPVSAPPPPPPPQPQPTPAPAQSRSTERKTSSIMSLLNADPEPPKRVADVSSAVKTSSTPPPQMSIRQPPPTSAPAPPRREIETGYPYARNPAQAPQSAIPPLKPYHTQSPQPQHMRVPSGSMPSSMDPTATAAEAPRDYYARHPYAQHQASASNSPQTHHYAQPGQHPQQHAPPPQQAQQAQMGYASQQSYQPYPVSQAHAASPTPQYAPHPSMSGRREPPQPSSREPWSLAQQQTAAQQQQQPQPQQQQQQQQLLHHQHQQQSPWPPSHQAAPKTTQPHVPAQSAWGAQHGVQAKPQVSSPLAPQHHNSWPTSSASQQPHALNLREPRAASVYGGHDAQSPAPGMVPHHQSHGSLGGGGSRYPPPQDARRPDPVVQQQQPPTQPYARYSNTPGPGGRDLRDPVGAVSAAAVRSYTPVSAFDPRGPPPPQQQQQQQQQQVYGAGQAQDAAAIREAQMREAWEREREREATILGRQLRPGDPYERGERRY
ncbi:SANT domain-containing protein [Madurella fahalii]|uniref:SANT domain-containing protein n=1 Tax=Madurella fahalii TaxID=1157608 RepID=A0ABQ0G552_9PEZI